MNVAYSWVGSEVAARSGGSGRDAPDRRVRSSAMGIDRIGGFLSGPTVLVWGYSATMAPAYARLSNLPNASWFKGEVLLTSSGDLVETDDLAVLGVAPDMPIDGFFFHPFVVLDAHASEVKARAHDDAFWSILRYCAALGMIAGRGVQNQQINPKKLTC